jgi:hypothetical protein
MLFAGCDLPGQLEDFSEAPLSGEPDGCHPWCDISANDELHVASAAFMVGGFSSAPLGAMQVNLADQTACCLDEACFIFALSLRTSYLKDAAATWPHAEHYVLYKSVRVCSTYL